VRALSEARAPVVHKLPSRLMRTHTPLRVAVVGVGGTGSEIVTGLIRLDLALQAAGRPGLRVHAFDPDAVSESNLVRQAFYAQDVGHNKAETLIRRVNVSYGLNWLASPERFMSKDAAQNWDLVLSCVDTRAARAQLHRWATQTGSWSGWGGWIDFGNEAQQGQVIWGEPHSTSKTALPCATQLHPDLIDLSLPEDTAPSCSAYEAILKQGLMTNRQVATLGLQMVWTGLKEGELLYHGYYFNFERATSVGLRVPQPEPKVTRPRPRRTPATAPAAALQESP